VTRPKCDKIRLIRYHMTGVIELLYRFRNQNRKGRTNHTVFCWLRARRQHGIGLVDCVNGCINNDVIRWARIKTLCPNTWIWNPMSPTSIPTITWSVFWKRRKRPRRSTPYQIVWKPSMVLVPTTATTSHCQLSTNIYIYIYISVYIHYIPTCWTTTLVGKPAAFSQPPFLGTRLIHAVRTYCYICSFCIIVFVVEALQKVQ
jgi:hypothetical protein